MSIKLNQEVIRLHKTVKDLVNQIAMQEDRLRVLEEQYVPLRLETNLKVQKKRGRPKEAN